MTELLPAIDLRDGRCVRLIQGDYDRQIDYRDDPAEVAAEFAAAGCRWIHVVDLDAARDGTMRNLDAISSIVQAADIQVEVGGGVRSTDAVQRLLDLGVYRTVIGTAALRDWDWFRTLIDDDALAVHIALGLDARDGRVAVSGWTEQTDVTATDLAEQVRSTALGAIIYTDIARDGMMTGPNIPAIEQMLAATDVPVVASGGVGSLDDIRALSYLDVGGIIVGRALYEGNFTIADAVATVRETST